MIDKVRNDSVICEKKEKKEINLEQKRIGNVNSYQKIYLHTSSSIHLI